jgi:riboflavin biosynthesis RibT protein
MLLRYKKTYEKIAMGLLSYMPGDKNAKKLQETIHQYESDDNWQLYLLKKDDDFIGLIGVELGDADYTLYHISVNPSFRGEGVGKEMVSKLQSLFPNMECKSTEETELFIKKCQSKGEEAD